MTLTITDVHPYVDHIRIKAIDMSPDHPKGVARAFMEMNLPPTTLVAKGYRISINLATSHISICGKEGDNRAVVFV